MRFYIILNIENLQRWINIEKSQKIIDNLNDGCLITWLYYIIRRTSQFYCLVKKFKLLLSLKFPYTCSIYTW